MYCKKCGKELINNEIICPQCGTPVTESGGGSIVKDVISEITSTISQIIEVCLSSDDITEKITTIRRIIVPCSESLSEESAKYANTIGIIIPRGLLILALCLLLLFTPQIYISGWFNEENVNAFSQTIQGEPMVEIMLFFILLYIVNFIALILVGRLWGSNRYEKVRRWFSPVSAPMISLILLFKVMSAYNSSYYYSATLTFWGVLFVLFNLVAIILGAYLFWIDLKISLDRINKQQ